MAKAILVCGKVCCGKTTYTASLQANGAVLLSSDELMRLLFDEYLGDRHDVLARRVNDYLLQKSLELLAAGVDVVLDWGFWTKEGREAVLDFYRQHGYTAELHYIEIDDATWQQRIEKRNANRGPSDYYVDDGLREKCLSRFEPPETADVWIKA